MTIDHAPRPEQSGLGAALMPPAPVVSVILVAWNVRALLERALESVYESNDPDAIEVIVVDNGSSDGTGEMLEERWPQVVRIALPENTGFGVANNIGMRHARGEFFLLLNTDARCLPSTIPAMLREFRADATIGCVGARHLAEDGSLQPSMNAFPTLFNDALELTELARLKPVQAFLRPRFPWWTDHATRTEPGWVNGACMMLRRSALDAVGAFDDAFFIYVEEIDLCYRLREAAWKVVFTPAAEVVHLEGRSLDAYAGIRLELRFWGHCHFYRKHYSPLRYRLFCSLVSLTAAARVLGLGLMAAADRLGVRAPLEFRAAVASDHGGAPLSTYLRAWWRITLHRTPDTGPLRYEGRTRRERSAR